MGVFNLLINHQVCCYKTVGNKSVIDYGAIDLLRIMYPHFKVVNSIFEIDDGHPFIYIGKMEYIFKAQQRLEDHIIVSTTGDYDLTDRNTLIDLAYYKHSGQYIYHHKDQSKGNNGIIDEKDLDDYDPKDITAIPKGKPKYVTEELIKSWSDQQFILNWKYLWVVGSLMDKELEDRHSVYQIIDSLSLPSKALQLYLTLIKDSNPDNIEYILFDFMDKSQVINPESIKNPYMNKLYKSFKASYGNTSSL